MGSVAFLDHTADVLLQVKAKDLNDLFRTAAQGLVGYVIANPEEIREEDTDEVKIQAESLSELLVNWLNELIFLIETRHRVYSGFHVEVQESSMELRGCVIGERLDSLRHVLDHEVKAITHHEASVMKTSEGWVGQVLMDI